MNHEDEGFASVTLWWMCNGKRKVMFYDGDESSACVAVVDVREESKQTNSLFPAAKRDWKFDDKRFCTHLICIVCTRNTHSMNRM